MHNGCSVTAVTCLVGKHNMHKLKKLVDRINAEASTLCDLIAAKDPYFDALAVLDKKIDQSIAKLITLTEATYGLDVARKKI